MFQKGEQVICVEDRPFLYSKYGNGDLHGLKRGRIYTVRWIGMYDRGLGDNKYHGVRLEEIHRGSQWDTPYDIRRFRPLRKGNTDISVFTAMLTPKQAKVHKKEKV